MNKKPLGMLYVIATPIGHLKDMTLRGIEVLKQVDLIAAEDTRHSISLLTHYGIQKKIISLHEHNERHRIERLLSYLTQGESIGLISDAGTPLISDPGYHLVKKLSEAGIPIVPIPGPCAAIAALSASGLPTDRFIFEGFLPAKTQAKMARLTELEMESRTLIFYESPHRVLSTLELMSSVFGAERKAVLARELTKLHETILRGTLDNLVQWVKEDIHQQKGEIVILIAGATKTKEFSDVKVLSILLNHLPLKQAVDLASQITTHKKNELYELALKIKNKT